MCVCACVCVLSVGERQKGSWVKAKERERIQEKSREKEKRRGTGCGEGGSFVRAFFLIARKKRKIFIWCVPARSPLGRARRLCQLATENLVTVLRHQHHVFQPDAVSSFIAQKQERERRREAEKEREIQKGQQHECVVTFHYSPVKSLTVLQHRCQARW